MEIPFSMLNGCNPICHQHWTNCNSSILFEPTEESLYNPRTSYELQLIILMLYDGCVYLPPLKTPSLERNHACSLQRLHVCLCSCRSMVWASKEPKTFSRNGPWAEQTQAGPREERQCFKGRVETMKPTTILANSWVFHLSLSYTCNPVYVTLLKKPGNTQDAAIQANYLALAGGEFVFLSVCVQVFLSSNHLHILQSDCMSW